MCIFCIKNVQACSCGSCIDVACQPVQVGLSSVCSACLQAQSRLRSPHMALQKPRNGGPLIISNKTFDDIVIDYKDSSEAFKAGFIFFGGIGVALLGFRAVSFGWKKWREKQIRYVSLHTCDACPVVLVSAILLKIRKLSVASMSAPQGQVVC